MSEHVSLDRIIDRVFGRDLDEDLVDHLATCDRCGDAERWARDLREAVAEGPPPEAPEELLERARAIPAEEPRPRTKRGWSIARLIEGAFSTPALAGVRGSATGQRLLYEVPGGHLDLEITRAPDDGEALCLTGQLLLDHAPPPSDILAILWRNRTLHARASGDPTGVFVLAPVPPGEYWLDLLSMSTGNAVRVGELRVEAREA
ncbi:MAG TPA: hypothetical protein VFG78_05145 [Gemmatimonadota bacterium]|nr:hypothetical protein [Gemmatimonadota bacterium]